MKKIFYAGLVGIALFEILKVFFIMPLPGSQKIDSINIAYFLHGYRWYFRAVFILMILVGFANAFRNKRKWVPLVSLLAVMVIIYEFNFQMTAESMFKQPQHLSFKTQEDIQLNDSSVVIGLEYNGEARGYPIRYLVYHHQVRDTVGGKPVMVTYCSVCRTGRIYEPEVNGHQEKFRLVGMDHYNAMFEDATTKSWWRQSTGQAIAGPLKGARLPEVESFQFTLHKMFELYPQAMVMQPDKAFLTSYDTLGNFEQGKSKSRLTGTDSLSWKKKSWVVGIDLGNKSKVYDWNLLEKTHVINDAIGKTPIVLVLSTDGQSFEAFERSSDTAFTIQHDTLISGKKHYDFSGHNLDGNSAPLTKVKAYQEFWHSWQTFHPQTLQYLGN